MKNDLKKWNVESFRDVNKQIKEVVKKLNALDVIDEAEGLDEVEMQNRWSLMGEFWSVSRRNESHLHQKSRVRWCREGDANT